MYPTLKALFDDYFKDIRFDNTFKEKVISFVRNFLTKNDDHVAFFGSGLLGVNPVRWNHSDTDYWWDDIFDGIYDVEIRDHLIKLKDIEAHRVVSSDALNHAFIYSLHRVHHSQYLNEKDKEELKKYIMISMNLKFLCSLMAHYFKYPADKGIAEKTFNSLSKHFDIKVLGSWAKMINRRSENYVASNTRYFKTYVDYNNDKDVVIMINDAQGRIRETVKEITEVYYTMLAENARILSSSSNIDLDGTTVLKDLVRKRSTYIRYIKNLLTTKDGVMKPDLISVIYKVIPSLQPTGLFEGLLETLTEEYQNKRYAAIFNRMLDNLLVYSFDVLDKNKIVENDLPGLIYRLKHIYMSGRVTDELLLKARIDFDKLVEAHDKRNKTKYKNTPLVSERCAVFLYIVLRTITMNYFK